jgi:hypothetical protein
LVSYSYPTTGGAQPQPAPVAWRPGEVSDAELEMLRQVTVKVNRQRLPWRGEIALGERDRLIFEIDIGTLPLDIYSLTLELERDEVTQGIPVDWNVMRANYKVSTREWQQRMQEEQYAGDCSVTLLYRGLPVPGFTSNIQLQVTRLAEQHYEYMREVLKAQNEKVLYSHKGRTHEISMLSAAKTAAAVRYEIVIAYYERLMKVLPDILDDPHRVLRRYVTRKPANTTQALSFESLRLAARTGAQWTIVPPKGGNVINDTSAAQELLNHTPAPVASPKPLPNGKGNPKQKAAPVSDWQARLQKFQEEAAAKKRPKAATVNEARVLPITVPVPNLQETFDTYENRFLKMTLKKLIALSRKVQEQLELEIATARREQVRSSRTRSKILSTRMEQNQQCIETLKQLRTRLEQTIKQSFLAPLGALGPRRTSVVLRENRFYRQIRQIAADVERDLDLVSSTVSIESTNKNVRLSSINQLYEYWVTVVVLQTMVDRLGFTVVAKEGKPIAGLGGKNRFNYILQSGGSMELMSPMGKRVVVHYDREYRGTQRPKQQSYRDFEDTDYEYETPQRPETDNAPVYYGYYEQPGGVGSTKRRPDIAIEVFDENERVPQIIVIDATYSKDRRTLYAKYEYRDSIRDFTKRDARSNTLARPVVAAWAVYPEEKWCLEHDEFRYGQLPLKPSPQAYDQIMDVLPHLLRLASAID